MSLNSMDVFIYYHLFLAKNVDYSQQLSLRVPDTS